MESWVQPEELKTDKIVKFSGGRGQDVWDMLTGCAAGRTDIVRKLLEREPSLANCQWAYFSPLHFAVANGHAELVSLLLQHGADATAKSGLSWQDNPLQKAQDRGNIEIAEMLDRHLRRTLNSNPLGQTMASVMKSRNVNDSIAWLKANPDAIRISDERGNTALHWAVLTRQLKLIDYLTGQGADLEAMRADGSKPIHLAMEGDYFYRAHRDLPAAALQNQWLLVGYLLAKGAAYDHWIAAAAGDTEYVRAALDSGAASANALDSSGRSALFYAAKYGYEHTLKTLLEHGADPNQAERDAPQGAALHAAAQRNHIGCARLLLEHGANPNADVESSGNPVSIALNKGFKEMQELLYAYGGRASLTAACWLGRTDLVGEILAANPSAVHEDGDYGPLTLAAGFGHTGIVRLLLTYKPDLNRPWYANNAMGYAFGSGRDMTQLLLDRGADPNLANWLGVTYLHQLAGTGNIELAKLLIEYGADLEAVDDEHGTTPLGWAAKNGQGEMVSFLLEQGAKRKPDPVADWAQPVVWAQRRGHQSIMEQLA
ncbi:MAG: ankyrin repeat protein [Paenibacillus sp.]|nr:ankyrin repeat protein [Paenibacillus sp.]